MPYATRKTQNGLSLQVAKGCGGYYFRVMHDETNLLLAKFENAIYEGGLKPVYEAFLRLASEAIPCVDSVELLTDSQRSTFIGLRDMLVKSNYRSYSLAA